MILKWANSEGIRQDNVDNKRKLPTETYTQYWIEKKHLCKLPYQDATGYTIIVKICSKLDRDVSYCCWEKQSLERFLDEMINYDELAGLLNNAVREKSNRKREQQNSGNSPHNNSTHLMIIPAGIEQRSHTPMQAHHQRLNELRN